MARLLAAYPAEKLTMMVGSFYLNRFAPRIPGPFAARVSVFPTTSQTGPRGTGRCKELVDWLLIVPASLYGLILVRRSRAQVILSVTHGTLFVAAWLTALLSHVPLVLIVHDDWSAGVGRGKALHRSIASAIFRRTLRGAARVYAVSDEMRHHLERDLGVESEVQLPATDPDPIPRREVDNGEAERTRICLAYAGTLSASLDGLRTLAALLRTHENPPAGYCELHIFAPVHPSWLRSAGLGPPTVVARGWTAQSELQPALAEADILFLPYSFERIDEGITRLSFPSKLADYLAVGKPVLLFGPHYSPVVRYARRHGFAEIVDTPDPTALRAALNRLIESPEHREALARQARATFRANHDASRQRAHFMDALSDLSEQHVRADRRAE